MRRMHSLQWIAALWLILFAVGGIWLVLHRGWVPMGTMGDCIPPPGYTGTFECHTPGHPYAVVGSLVLVAAISGAVILWRTETNRQAGRPAAGHPRE